MVQFSQVGLFYRIVFRIEYIIESNQELKIESINESSHKFRVF